MPGSITATTALSLCARLLGRTQRSEQGVYWSAPNTPALPAQFAASRRSLAMGSSGPLLALLSQQQTTANPKHADTIEQACLWLRSAQSERRNESAASLTWVPGFYLGDGGWWWTQRELTGTTEVVHEDEGQKITAALSDGSGAIASNVPIALSCGVAGTLLGALVTGSNHHAPRVRLWLDAVVRRAHISEQGLTWDRLVHASRPPLGFVNGSAGIDYALALAGTQLDLDCSSLTAASIAHSNAEYRADLGNWPDYESHEDRSKDSTFQAKLKAAVKSGEGGGLFPLVDSCSWSTGAAGILVSRATVMATTRDARLDEICQVDCDRATARIERFLATPQATVDLTLARGLCGILLAVHSCQEIYPPAVPLLAKIRQKLNDALASGKADLRLNDNSLFTGMSGIAYALLKCESDTPTDNCIAPGLVETTKWLRQTRIDTSGHRSTGQDSSEVTNEVAPAELEGSAETGKVSCAELYRTRFPRHCVVPEFLRQTDLEAVPSLKAIREVAARVIPADIAPVVRAGLDHELDFAAKAAAQTGNSFLFLREQHKSKEAGVLFRDPDRRVALHATYRLDATVAELLTLPFDPEAPPDAQIGKPTQVLRISGSLGMAEQKVTPLVYHLLEAFRTRQPGIDAIKQVAGRVHITESQLPQVADLCYQYLRQFASIGVLEAEPPNRLTLFAAQATKRQTRRKLFPGLK